VRCSGLQTSNKITKILFEILLLAVDVQADAVCVVGGIADDANLVGVADDVGVGNHVGQSVDLCLVGLETKGGDDGVGLEKLDLTGGVLDYDALVGDLLNGGLVEALYAVVAQVPKGRVISYGAIARMLGRPGAARTVGWAMRACPCGRSTTMRPASWISAAWISLCWTPPSGSWRWPVM